MEEEEEEEEEKMEEKIPHMCESIGHRPLWGRCPKSGVKRGILRLFSHVLYDPIYPSEGWMVCRLVRNIYLFGAYGRTTPGKILA